MPAYNNDAQNWAISTAVRLEGCPAAQYQQHKQIYNYFSYSVAFFLTSTTRTSRNQISGSQNRKATKTKILFCALLFLCPKFLLFLH
jgi:hypothetical protein